MYFCISGEPPCQRSEMQCPDNVPLSSGRPACDGVHASRDVTLDVTLGLFFSFCSSFGFPPRESKLISILLYKLQIHVRTPLLLFFITFVSPQHLFYGKLGGFNFYFSTHPVFNRLALAYLALQKVNKGVVDG